MWEHILRYPYLYLDLFTIAGPLALSFDKKIAFWRRWPALLAGILVANLVFIPWDMAKTAAGVWWFNPDYLLGIYIGNLPLEEWLFFWVVPYATVFIYACWRGYFPRPWPERTLQAITILLFAFCVVMAIAFHDRWYTLTTFSLLAIMLVIHYQWLGTRHLTYIYIGWIITLAPFFFVNGVLTALPVVLYNDAENLGFRLGTIPFEDGFYGFLLYLITISVMEARLAKHAALTA